MLASTNSGFARALMALTALLAWAAIILQLPIMIGNANRAGISTPIAVANFFSYFTILTNILIALCLTFYLLAPQSPPGRFFSRASVRSALAVYIAIVGAVYMLILRDLWDPEGLEKAVDVTLHNLTPVLYVLCWFLFFSASRVAWKGVLRWLAYPLLYLAYSLVRGALVGWYPYPFIDARQNGYARVLLNSGGLVVVFLILSYAATWITHWRSRSLLETTRTPAPGRSASV